MSFHPVINLPSNYLVLDLSNGLDTRSKREMWTIGRYNEKRQNMYVAEIFNPQSESEARNIHMGIDIGCPVGTDIFAFDDGEIFLFEYRAEDGGYGATLITKHKFNSKDIYVLHGHLSKKSLENKKHGKKIKRGEVIAWVGEESENGGWPPHLHFQISYLKPDACDMPGVVSADQHQSALETYPDPRIILGSIY